MHNATQMKDTQAQQLRGVSRTPKRGRSVPAMPNFNHCCRLPGKADSANTSSATSLTSIGAVTVKGTTRNPLTTSICAGRPQPIAQHSPQQQEQPLDVCRQTGKLRLCCVGRANQQHHLCSCVKEPSKFARCGQRRLAQQRTKNTGRPAAVAAAWAAANKTK
jgi:hypothetical protein